MYQPEFVVRIEWAQTDIDNLREWRVVVGGMQRGGMTAGHAYSPISGEGLLDNVEAALAEARSLLEAYASTLSCYQLTLPLLPTTP